MGSQQFLRAATRVSIGALFVGALTLSACGTSSSGSNANKALKIGTELPVSSTDAAQGLPTQYGVDLAVSQNKDLGNGYTLSVVNKNDEGASGADGTIGASNIQQLEADPQVMAVVGPFNSGVAKSEIPIVNKQTLVLISPSNTNPGLTLQQYAASRGINFELLHPAGKPNAYFRIPANDIVQGKADADIALSAPINAKTAFVVDDNTVYGKGLADYISTAFTAGGGKLVGDRSSISKDQASSVAGPLADKIKSLNPDVVFFGGVNEQGGGVLKKALFDKGYTKPLVGGDGIADDPSWITTAGSGASNTYGTVAAPDISTLTSGAAAKFKSDYTTFVAGKPSNDLIPYSAQSYDAAMLEITAIKNVIASGKPVTRLAVRDEVAKIKYTGVTGSISFDANGDNASTLFSVYTVNDSGKWVYLKQVNG